MLSFWQLLGPGHSCENSARRIGRDDGRRGEEGHENCKRHEGRSRRGDGQETKDQGFAWCGSVEEGERWGDAEDIQLFPEEARGLA